MQHTGDVKLLRLDRIERDPQLQPRSKMDKATIQRYMCSYKEGITLPPVIVGRVGTRLLLVDGWHRYEARRQLEEKRISASILPMTWREALGHAALANIAHGLPLKRADHRHAFRLYMKARLYALPAGGVKSFREIANEMGGQRTYGTMRYWMMQDFPKVFNREYSREDDGGEKGGLMDTPCDVAHRAATMALEEAQEYAAYVKEPMQLAKLLDSIGHLQVATKRTLDESRGAMLPDERRKFDESLALF